MQTTESHSQSAAGCQDSCNSVSDRSGADRTKQCRVQNFTWKTDTRLTDWNQRVCLELPDNLVLSTGDILGRAGLANKRHDRLLVLGAASIAVLGIKRDRDGLAMRMDQRCDHQVISISRSWLREQYHSHDWSQSKAWELVFQTMNISNFDRTLAEYTDVAINHSHTYTY